MKSTGIQLAGYLTVIIITASAGLFFASAAADNETFDKKCGLCHDLPDPNVFSQKDWVKQVSRMADRANLTPKEKTAIMALNTEK